MTQRDIDRAVARATGETVGRVQQMGFTLIVIPPPPATRRYLTAERRCPVSAADRDRSSAVRSAAQA